jgi:hypothetical protein
VHALNTALMFLDDTFEEMRGRYLGMRTTGDGVSNASDRHLVAEIGIEQARSCRKLTDPGSSDGTAPVIGRSGQKADISVWLSF